MSSIIYTSPNKEINLIFEVLHGSTRVNSTPSITRIITPSLGLLSGYPKDMAKIDIGLYTLAFTVPIGLLGTFIADISWINPVTLISNKTYYQIVSRMPPNMGGGYITSL